MISSLMRQRSFAGHADGFQSTATCLEGCLVVRGGVDTSFRVGGHHRPDALQ